MKTVKILATVSPEILDTYNKLMEAEGEDIYVISKDYVGDCSEGILADTAACENTDEVIVSADYLIEEVRWNLTEKLCGMAHDAYDGGEISKKKYHHDVIHWHAVFNHFKHKAKNNFAEPWEVTTIEVED